MKRKKNKFNPKLKAFTLPELLVVLVIIGILILLALPELMPLVTRAHSLEAKNALKMVHTLEKTHFYEYSKYSDDLEAIGFEAQKLVGEQGGSAKYEIEIIEYSVNSFKARATSIVDFDGDGQFNVWEVDQDGNILEVVKD
ncbi:prepilin-type N-terminal cleavage/methylation domain-containing protein [Saccharicrinis aurantiacus]|uniref:prepilin-type N-terminal cleavage/methylation domain-containing protein n=1 Tax=Saccharicrinis aurantiacus TaxID=1849719 RepID=UPI000839990A|nr:prepilin-type N-terminal cleavage/methylation domain-containing protein [Saccharicrinis aurantiacus]